MFQYFVIDTMYFFFINFDFGLGQIILRLTEFSLRD